MSGFLTTSQPELIRSELWSSQLKDILEDELMAARYVRLLSEFPDGDTFTIPSIGQAEVDDYAENEDIQYRAMDTGEFQFQITEYKSSATYITRKMRQDSFYSAAVEASFVPKQARAIMESFETEVLALHQNQTASDANLINDAPHRFVASGGSQEITLQDFALAHSSLKKANVPMTNMIAIVDPSVEYTLNTLTDLVSVANNPRWEGIVADGIAPTGMRFVKNVYGFDVWTSNFLDDGITETIGAKTVAAGNGVANLFFSASPDVVPFIGAWRQMPQVDAEFNKDKQREEYVTTARYGLDLFRPENLVTVLSDKTALPQS